MPPEHGLSLVGTNLPAPAEVNVERLCAPLPRSRVPVVERFVELAGRAVVIKTGCAAVAMRGKAEKGWSFTKTSKSTAPQPCTNAPIECPECPCTPNPHFVWTYNMKEHWKKHHRKKTMSADMKKQIEITKEEKAAVLAVGEKGIAPKAPRKPKAPSLRGTQKQIRNDIHTWWVKIRFVF